MTKIIESLKEWQLIRKKLSHDTVDLGFVPTLGNLHAGHESLLQRSQRENSITVLSVFVNPTQFDNKNDFKNYPRTLDQDVLTAEKNGIDYVLAPDFTALYPDNYAYKIVNADMSSPLEGAFRPGHFDGVLTIVLKLLLLVKPTHTYFGEKDYQQLTLIKGLAKAFFLETEIVECATVRNEFGLPLSSRNSRLTEEQYRLAQWFPKIFHSGESCENIKKQLIQKGFTVDYVEDYERRRFAAVRLADIRLIDNIVLE